ncbi:MAG: hypothetical protein GY927_07615 [bacterium]|nr:hypothetical protein [bacterium]
MYQPAQLDSFIRLLICHFGSVLTQGEQLLENQPDQLRLDLLLYAIEQGADQSTIRDKIEQRRDSEMLFALQMNQSREWIDRLGQLDPHVERDTDEFLAATFPIEKLVRDFEEPRSDALCENNGTSSQKACLLHGGLANPIDVEAMMCAIFELLGRLEDQYELMEELLDEKQVVNGGAFGQKYGNNHSAKIIPLFGAKLANASQDNDL